MKKLLLIAILMLALVFTAVACTGGEDPADTTVSDDTTVETPTEAPTAEPEDPTEPTETTAEPEETTEEPEETTEEPEETTEEPEETTEEVTTPDPADPVWIIEPEAIANAATSGSTTTAEVNEEGYVRLTSTGGDPWILIAGNLGTMPNYLAIRYRTNTANQGEFFTGSGAGPAAGNSFVFSWNGNEEWNFLVFDLSTCVSSITDGVIGHIRFDFFTGGGEEGAYMDVAYIALFNTAEYAAAYDFEKYPPYISVNDADAGKVGVAYDSFWVNGQDFFNTAATGNVAAKLDEANNTITFDVDADRETVMLRGWVGFDQPIAKLGYFIDEYTMTYGEFTIDTEAPVKDPGNGGEHATRYEITVPVVDLEGGIHTVGFVALLEDGTVVLLHKEIKIVVVPYTVDETIPLATGHGAPFSGAPNNYFGQRFNVGENILKQITITDMATYSDGNTNTWSFKIWQWNTDYATTTAAEPLFVANGENHNDNAPFVMDVPVEALITGDIYYEITYLSGSGCFTGWTADTVAEGVETYVAGSLATGSYGSSIVVGVPTDESEKEIQFSVVFGEIYTDADKGTKFDGNLILEKNLGPTYFDGVRTGDWMEFGINVETAGDYNVCMVFGWLDHTGVYTILVDGEEVGKIENTIPGTDWRTWTDSSSVKINLTEGEHTVRVVMGSDGPNVYGIKFTYVEPMPENIALNKPISADSVEKPQHEAIYANDGDENTRWCGMPKGEANLIVDLEAVYTLDKISFLFENCMGDYTISVSENGEDYEVVRECSAEPMSSVAFTREFDLNGATARYIKISRGPAADRDYWFSIYELYVYSVQ